MAEKIIVEVKIQSNKGKGFDAVSEGADQAKKSVSSLTDSVTKNGGAMAVLNTLTGGIAQQFKDMYEASALLGTGLSVASIKAKLFGTSMRAAMTATGIGAIVVAVSLMVEYWDEIVDSVDDFARFLGISEDLSGRSAVNAERELKAREAMLKAQTIDVENARLIASLLVDAFFLLSICISYS